jgi:phospholipid/cholesterol/gamma-HCH transport system substrate-binding protein
VTRTLKIGIFTTIGIAMIVGFSVYVNDHPYWYRACNEVNIHVDDATGLRRKSPVKTLGLDIGYINSVQLDGERVMVKVCVTGPVKLNADTRAFIRSSGFLGDKFLELKPVDRLDGASATPASSTPPAPAPEDDTTPSDELKNSSHAPLRDSGRVPDSIRAVPYPAEEQAFPEELAPTTKMMGKILSSAIDFLVPSAQAADNNNPTLSATKEAELQDTVKKVGKLIDQLTLMVGDLREVTQQKDFKETIVNLNAAMKHLELLLRPSGKVMKNVDDAMESLRNTMASAEAVMNKVKEGEGSLGKFINDPALYEDLRGAIQSINLLLGKAGALKTYVDIGGWQIPAYDGGKARFSVIIAPNPGRYYLIGLTSDPRGRDRKTVTTTRVNNGPVSTEVKNVNEEKGLRITALFGKYFGPLDLRVGVIEDFGAVGAGIWFDENRRYGIHADVYYPGKNQQLQVRAYARAQIWSSVYVIGGVDGHRKYFNPDTGKNKIPYFAGAGLFFDDDDLKYLLAFK